jgi:hypothetical protein
VAAVGQLQAQLAGLQLQQQQQQRISQDSAPLSDDVSPFSLQQQQQDTTAAAAVRQPGTGQQPPFRRVMVFVDNAGVRVFRLCCSSLLFLAASRPLSSHFYATHSAFQNDAPPSSPPQTK